MPSEPREQTSRATLLAAIIGGIAAILAAFVIAAPAIVDVCLRYQICLPTSTPTPTLAIAVATITRATATPTIAPTLSPTPIPTPSGRLAYLICPGCDPRQPTPTLLIARDLVSGVETAVPLHTGFSFKFTAGPNWSHDGNSLALMIETPGVYFRIFRVSMDGTFLKMLGESGTWQDNSPSFSADDTQVAFTSNRDGKWQIYAMDASGVHVHRITRSDTDDLNPSWSPDNQYIAFMRGDKYHDIYFMRLSDNKSTNLFHNDGVDSADPVWSPDNSGIAFTFKTPSHYDIKIVSPITGIVTTLPCPGSYCWAPAWSPDSRWVAFVVTDTPTSQLGDIWFTDSRGTGVPKRVTTRGDVYIWRVSWTQ